MSSEKMSTEQVHNDLLELKQDVRALASIQSDMRDNIVMLTENQKRIEEIYAKQHSLEQSTHSTDVRMSIVETELKTMNTKLSTYDEKMKNIPESTFITKAVMWFVGVVIAALTVGGITLIVNLITEALK